MSTETTKTSDNFRAQMLDLAKMDGEILNQLSESHFKSIKGILETMLGLMNLLENLDKRVERLESERLERRLNDLT